MHFLTIVLLLFSSFQAQDHVNKKNGIGIQGYDPVAYFTGENALKGSKEVSTNYQGTTYFFGSEENKAKFSNDPDRFLPQYGGWCAYAIGDTGDKVKIDPDTYKILNGKLYLFYNFRGTNTLEYWNDDEANLLAKAEQNWRQIIN
ncbi:MAG: YHS domain-containing (seleno)protein [Bacteroidota bacterium]